MSRVLNVGALKKIVSHKMRRGVALFHLSHRLPLLLLLYGSSCSYGY